MSYDLTSIKTLVENFDYFFCDCDGVIWSGDHPIDKSFEVVQWL